METVEVDGLRIAYERAGTGPPLVLLHGYVGDSPAPRGDRRSKSSATSSPWWCGTRPAQVVPRTHLNRSVSPVTPIAWPDSSPSYTFPSRMWPGCRSGGVLALEFIHRHPAIPMTLILASAYAGWLGSLSADAADHRLQQALELADLSPAEFVRTLLPTMFSEKAPQEAVEAFGVSMQALDPHSSGQWRLRAPWIFRMCSHALTSRRYWSMARGTWRAPLSVAKDLEKSIPDSRLVVLQDAGHVCNIEAPRRI